MSRLIVSILVLIVATSMGVSAQSTKHYDKDGLSFDYPSNWTMQDSSDSKKQYIVFAPPNSDSQITVFAHRELIETAEDAAQAKTGLVDAYITQQTKQMRQMGMTPTRTDGTATMGGSPAEVAHVRGSLDGAEGEAGVYWVTLNKRVVIVSTFGPDQDLKRLAAALEALRKSIAIAAPATPILTAPESKPAKP